MKTLLLIPAYNEQDNIRQVVGQIQDEYSHYDFLVVNDGSIDNTLGICEECGFPVLNLPVNLGLTGAFQAGMKYAYRKGYEHVVQFDADGQHLPEYIAPLIEALNRGNDIAIASRFLRSAKPNTFRMAGSRLISTMIYLTTGQKLTDPTSGMRAFSREMVGQFATRLNYGPEPDTISYLIKQGAKVEEIPAQMQDRVAGQSYLTFYRSIKYMFFTASSILMFQWMRK